MSGRGVISKDVETMLDNTKVLNQLRTELKQLRNCQQELQLLKEKLVADEIWKKTIENFLSCHLGFDVQRAMKEPPSSPSYRQTAFDKSPTVGDIVSGRYQCRRSPSSSSSANSTGGLGVVVSSIYTSNNEISNSKSDSTAIPIYSSSHLPGSLSLASQMDSKNRSLHRLGNKVFTTTLSNTTRSSKYSSSYAEATVIDQDVASSALTGKRKLSSDDLIWSSTPTFPLSDTIAHCTGDSSPTDNDQDTESDSRRDSTEFTEVKFQEIEDKIREVVPVGSRKSMYECTICGKSLTQRQNARLHVRRVHFLERLKCSACGRGFYDRRCVTNHKAICPKYAEWSIKNKESSLSMPDNTPISTNSMTITTYHSRNQLRTSSSLSDDSPLVDDSENDQDTSAGNSWMEKSRSSPSVNSGTLIKDEGDGSRDPVTFIINSNNNGDDNLSMRKESDQHSTRKARKEEGNEDGSSPDNLFYAPEKSLVVVEIVPEMFHFEDTNN